MKRKIIFKKIWSKLRGAKTCSWCGHRGVPGDGGGIFMDVDAFPGKGFSYNAIPVCGGCGGLGIEYPSTDFKNRTSRICDLRFKFYPIDKFPEPPSIVPFTYLKELLKELSGLVEIYGNGSDSYASRLIHPDSAVRNLLKMFEELVQVDLDILHGENNDLPPEQLEENRAAMIALYSGEFQKGFQLYEALLEKYPEDGTLWHDYAVLQIMINRNDSKIDELWQKATLGEPKKALHFFQAGKYYLSERKLFKALEYFKGARAQSDWADFQVAYAVDLNEIITTIESDIYWDAPQTIN